MSNGIQYITDFHAYQWSEFSKPLKDPYLFNTRVKSQTEAIHNILDKASEKGFLHVNGGDLFHERVKVDSRIFYNMYKEYYSHPDVPCFILRGNHDSYNNDMGSPSSIDTLGFLPNVTVVSTPSTFEVEVQGKKVNLYFMPYGENVDEMKDTLHKFGKQAKEDEHAILIAHIGIDGAVQGKHSHRLASAFSLDDLCPDSYDVVLLGHYHKRQYLGGRKDVFYGGSTIPLTFNDEGEAKGYDMLSYEGNKLKDSFVEVPSPKFLTLNTVEDNDDLIKNNFVRLQVSESDSNREMASVSKDDNVRVEIKPEVKDTNRLKLTEKDSDSPQAITNKFIEQYVDTDDKELAKLASETLEEVTK